MGVSNVKWWARTVDDTTSYHDIFSVEFPVKQKKKLLYPHFTGEHPCRSVVWIKLQRNVIGITLWHVRSPVNSLHVFRTTFNENTSRGLLLDSKVSHIFSLLFFIWLYCVIKFNFINDYIKKCEKKLGPFYY